MKIHLQIHTIYPSKKDQQVLYGDQALQFLRFRKGYADQDLGRIRAQQQFIKATVKQVLKPANIVNIPQMIKSYYNNVETNIPLDLIVKFSMNAKAFDSERIQMATLPGEGKYINGASYFIPDEEETSKIVKSLFTEYRAVENMDDNDDEVN